MSGLRVRDLRESGLLWLINRVVFHPRGFALGVVRSEPDGEFLGWVLLGDGSEPWTFEQAGEPELLRATEKLFAAAATHNRPGGDT